MKVRTAIVLGSISCIAYSGYQMSKSIKKSFDTAEFSYEVRYGSETDAEKFQKQGKIEKIVNKLLTKRESYSAFCEFEECFTEVHASSATKFQEAMTHHINHYHS